MSTDDVAGGRGHEPAPLWRPSASAFTDSAMARFATANGFDPHDADALHRWSIGDRGAFWRAVWDAVGIIGTPGTRVEVPPTEQDPPRPGHMFGTRWFPDARLNYAENLLRGDGGRLAVVAADETGVHTRLTLRELRRRVAGAQRGLRALGVGAGDVVAGILPNTIEAVVAILATASLGAVWAGVSPDFGERALIDRLGQVHPSVLIAVGEYRYDGRAFPVADRVRAVRAAVGGIPVVTVGAGWEERFGTAGLPDDAEPEYRRGPFDAPLAIMFTSGTTGLPKCIVHSAGGVLIEHLKEHVLHGDVRPGDAVFWYSSIAWMMHGWLLSALGAEAAIVLVDGHPSPRRGGGHGTGGLGGGEHGTGAADTGHLWRIAAQAGITHFGTSPRYLMSLAEAGFRPGAASDLGRLRQVLTSGAPISAETMAWTYENVKRDLIFASISGGTDIFGCFALGSPLRPVYGGELTSLSLGLAVHVLDERGAPVVGVPGDLVCTEAFPSMPLTFLGDGGDERYRAAYFARRDDIWTHGDLAELTARGTLVIHGRSDTTLKPSGVRIGTAELYRVLETDARIADCIAFGHVENGNEEVVLCVVPEPGVQLTDALAAELKARIRTLTSPRHVPKHVFAVSAVPYTFSGKKVEAAAKTLAAGGAITNEGAIANPECLPEFAALFA